jgi:uncharacterized membrane protein
MSKKAKKRKQDKMAAKKAAVMGTQKKNRIPLFMTIAGVLLIAGAAALFIHKGNNKKTAIASAPLKSSSTAVKFPAVLFQDGKARHFEHVDGNFSIRYFILKSSDGVIRAAFDACDVCWPAGKGYYQEGDYMVCRNCGRKFASVLVNEVKGGCNPAPLNRIMENGQVIIQVKDILGGKQYFNFSGKA